MARPSDFHFARFHRARFRVLGSDAHGLRRTIVFGPAILVRPTGGEAPWTLAVRADRPLEPIAPRCPKRLSLAIARLAHLGTHHRMAAAIAIPTDFQRHRIPMASRLLRGRRLRMPLDAASSPPSAARRTIYGWSLAYRFPDSTGSAIVDPHDDVPDLPAFYESAGELLDRINHLEARGIETRPIALLVQEQDFVHDGRGRRINRYFPALLEAGPKPPN